MKMTPVDSAPISPRVTLRRGSRVYLTGGPRHGRALIARRPGPHEVRRLFVRRGELFANVVALEAGIRGATYTVRLTGRVRRSRILPTISDRPYRARLIRR